MDRVTYQSQNKNEEAFSKEVRKRVRAYFRDNNIDTQGNWKLYLKSVIMLAMYLGPFILVLTIDMHPILALGMAILMGIGEAGLGMSVMHDGAHGVFSKRKWLNKLAASTIYLMGSNTYNWKMQHNIKHHTDTNIDQHDGDISSQDVIRLCEHTPVKNFQRFQHIYAFALYGLMTFLRFFGDVPILLRLIKERKAKGYEAAPSSELGKLLLTKVLYLIAIIGLPLLFTEFSIWQILIGFASLHIIAGIIMSTVFQLAHIVEGAEQPLPDAENVIHSEWAVHQLKTTSDFGRNNGLFSWYIGGLDYQIEHHLFQNVSHIHYQTLAPIVEATAIEFGFKYNLKANLYVALASHYRRLKELGSVQVN